MRLFLALVLVLFIFGKTSKIQAQCADAMGDGETYGDNSWIGYVYNQADNFDLANYQGFVTEPEEFDQSFCGSNCIYEINGCDIITENFTVRYKMRKDFAPGVYRLVIGGDDGVRLSIDGGNSYILNGYNIQPYTTFSTLVCLDGSSDLILDYYDNEVNNRVTFDYTYYGPLYGGQIGADQLFCFVGTKDPAPFTNIESPYNCADNSFTYLWQVSEDSISWSDIALATNITYDIPSGATGNKYYRRQVQDGVNTAYSNTILVSASAPQGDEVTYGDGSWIGYVYDGMKNFETDYKGEIFETEMFNENFGTTTGNIITSGCATVATTFSVRFKMKRNFPAGNYTFTVGSDDGVRLSLDGGSTFIIDNFSDHGFQTLSTTVSLADDTYDLVMDYYENGGENRVTFDYTTDATLPVTLVDFEGECVDGITNLKWRTASEKENDYFLIQRSQNGIDYRDVGSLKGSGNSVNTIYYNFHDNNPKSGINYYRLKQVDFNGDFSFSSIVSVLNFSSKNIEIFPNPVNGIATINYEGQLTENVKVSVIGMHGNNIKTFETPTLINWKCDLSDLPSGSYIIKFIIEESVFHKRVLLKNKN